MNYETKTALTSLPKRTQEVFDTLVKLCERGGLRLTLEQIADEIGISRRALFKHFTRLRYAGLLWEHEAFQHGATGQWRRFRGLGFPNPPTGGSQTLIYTNNRSHAEVGDASRLQHSASRCADRALSGVHVSENHPLEVLFENARLPRAIDSRKLPPYPSADTCPAVHVPRMPRLSGDRDSDARLLVRAYKAACWMNYGRKPRVDAKSAFRMKSAVAALWECKIDSPYAFAAFRVIAHHLSDRKAAPPKIDYVFSRKVVEANAEQFRRKAESYDVLEKRILTPAHVRLLVLWENARRAAASPNVSRSGEYHTEEVANSALPSDVYAKLLAEAKEQRHEIEADLYRRMASGEWIW